MKCLFVLYNSAAVILGMFLCFQIFKIQKENDKNESFKLPT